MAKRVPRALALLFVVSLFQYLPVYAHVAPATPAPPTLRRGAHGPAVCALQRRLTDWNYRASLFTTEAPGLDGLVPDYLIIDGVFGRKVEQWVRAFQKDMGLLVDGIVGPQTWSRLPQMRAAERLSLDFHSATTWWAIYFSTEQQGTLYTGPHGDGRGVAFSTKVVHNAINVVVFDATDPRGRTTRFTARFRAQGGVLMTAPGKRAELLYAQIIDIE